MERSPKSEKIVCVDFEDTGDWWEFTRFLTVRQQKLYTTLAVSMQNLDINDEERVKEVTQLTEELVALCTVGWSYSETVDAETLVNEVPGHHYMQVQEMMGDLYIPLVKTYIEKGLNNYSLLSREENQSQQNSLSA